MAFTCDNCSGIAWVCEYHLRKPWLGSSACGCGGAGLPCPVCQDNEPHIHPQWPQLTEVRQKETDMARHPTLTLCEPTPFLFFENGQIAVSDGERMWMVIVTCEAMKATADPPEKSLKRLIRYAEFYRDLAAAAISRNEDLDGKVWVRESDVRSALLKNYEPSSTLSRAVTA
jgi:hypothetical protein